MKINYSLIKAKSKELENYPGFLPGIILMEIDIDKYYSVLEKEGLFEQLYDKLNKSRRQSFTQMVYELKSWVEDNPEYKDFIIED